MKALLRAHLPVWLKKSLKYSYYSALDLRDHLWGTTDPLYPPRRLNFVGSHDFKAVGDEFCQHFTSHGGLKPHHKVLDIGCGIGRMAIPLTKIITQGHYEGFDIDTRGIEWCQKNITPRCPHFTFQYVDIYNKFYNPKGQIQAQDFRFPFPDNTFDFIFATSVFTHLLPSDAQNYLEEVSRVLAPGGRFFSTWFVRHPHHPETSKSNIHFAYHLPQELQCFYSHPENPEAETGYDFEWIEPVFANHNLTLKSFLPGNWRGSKGTSYQDIVVATKP